MEIELMESYWHRLWAEASTQRDELADALRGMVELCESPDFDGRPSNAAMNSARNALAKVSHD